MSCCIHSIFYFAKGHGTSNANTKRSGSTCKRENKVIPRKSFGLISNRFICSDLPSEKCTLNESHNSLDHPSPFPLCNVGWR